jgi:hypothetical protein
VKPELFSSFTMSFVSIPARFLFVGLLTEADDAGRLMDSPKKLCGILFPHDDDVTERKVTQWLNELVEAGCINRYSAGQGRYLHFPNWEDHQRISKPTPSRFPDPPGISPESSGISQGNPGKNSLGKGKGTGKGNRERERDVETPAEPLVLPFSDFWDAYPKRHGKKLGKAKAEIAWRKLTDTQRLDAIAAIGNYRFACDAGLTLAKDPERWIRGECWTDWQEPAQAEPTDIARATAPAQPKPEPCPDCVDGWCDDPSVTNSVYRCETCNGTGRKVAA